MDDYLDWHKQYLLYPGVSQVSGGFLQTAQTWVCSASCAHALSSMFVCLFDLAYLFVCLFVCFTDNLSEWVSWKGGLWLLLKNYGVFYFNDAWWDHIPDVNCSGIKKRKLQCWCNGHGFLTYSNEGDTLECVSWIIQSK